MKKALLATAIAFAKRTGCGLSASVQTDVPRFTLIYAGGIIRRMFGPVIGSSSAPAMQPLA